VYNCGKAVVESMNTIEIYGVKFLKCAKDDCKWNVGYTPGDLNRQGLEFTARHDDIGIRVCNFGCTALALGKNPDSKCPHKQELCDMLAEDSSSLSRIWGRLDPNVARRALGVEQDFKE
jgi:hypothetical protein